MSSKTNCHLPNREWRRKNVTGHLKALRTFLLIITARAEMNKILTVKILTNLTKICPFINFRNPTEHDAAILLLALHIK